MLRIVPATARLSKVAFRSGIDWLTYPPAYFSCGNCTYTLTLVMRDFMRHEGTTHTNLSLEDAARIDQANTSPQAFAIVCNAFLDFYCPECDRPTRIYYYGDELIGSNAYGYVVGYVIEETTGPAEAVHKVSHLPDPARP